jgi:anti-anti-sigma factor
VDFAYEQAGDVILVRLAGRLDASAVQPAELSFSQLLTSGTPRIAIDMSELTYIGSAGLRVLLVFAKKVRQSDGKVALFDLVPEVREVFSFSGFDTIFAVHANSAAAIAAVGD